MDDDARLRDFFLDPPGVRQREYEALRAVFIDNLSQKAAAQRFGLSYEAFRQLVHSFRHSFNQGEDAPPFSTGPTEAARADSQRGIPSQQTILPNAGKKRQSLTSAR
jgi:hypothetical protein